MRFTEESEASTFPRSYRGRWQQPSDRRSRAADRNPLEEFETVLVVSNRQPYRHEYDESDETNVIPDDEATDRVSDGGSVDAADGSIDDDRLDRSGPTGSQTAVGSFATRRDSREISVDRPTGGLTAGLDPVLKRTNGTWIAWGDGEADEDVVDDRGCVQVPPEDPSYTLQRVWLDEDEVDAYYYGFSNRVLWPICHEFPELVELRPGDFAGYRKVNRTFADAVTEHATEESLVWVQDYHFGLAPAMIQEAVPSSTTVGQFWHIPWPNPDVFRSCPHGRELLDGILGNDLLGFHVDDYVDHFLECVETFHPDATIDDDRATVRHDGSVTRVVSTPMGVDARKHERQSRNLDGSRIANLRTRYDIPADVALGVGIDRLDYSKGIPERLAAIERFFERWPAWRGSFTFVQKATPSRTEIDTYEELGECVRTEVDRINERFATAGWRPIVYTEDYLAREDLCALYRHADVMIVSSLLDGMNLVAQEYVASSVDRTGALLLSEHVGSHETIGDAAYTIDPHRPNQIATTLEAALSTSPAERRRRMDALRRRVFDLDIEWWMSRQFDELARAADRERSIEAGGVRNARPRSNPTDR